MAGMVNWDEDSEPHRRQEDSRSGGLRHRVALPAQIKWKTGGPIDAQIHNVSSVGMYLRHPMLVAEGGIEVLSIGDVVTVSFAPDHGKAPDKKVSLSAEIVRRHPHGVGVRFLGMTKAQKHALRILALLAVAARAAAQDGDNGSAQSKSRLQDARAIMGVCRRVLQRRLPNLIWALRTEVASQLRLMGNSKVDTVPGDPRKEADLIEEKGAAIGRTIERRVLQSFAEMAGLDDTQELLLSRVQRAKIKAAAGDEMSLMADKAVAGAVAMDATCQRLELALIGKSFDVNLRLANVLRRRIDNVENPIAPAVMCRMLWQSVTEYCESPRVHACLHAAMVKQITPLLSELYDDLERTLNEQGVPKAFGNSEQTKRS